ncbi:MAG TPA: phosphotransferase family protein [Myxococcaceae bacterium]|nr:phosphotransferase family protein [Myxococcaceae bacterium]
MTTLDPTRPVRPGEELDPEALRRVFERHAPELGGAVSIEQFPKGHSNLTYLLTVAGTELVLRRPPRGAKQIKAGHDMRREYTVLSRLRTVWPKVPRTLFLVSEGESPFGVEFYVMERVQGLILRGTTLPPGVALDAAGMRAVSETLVDTLVELHAVDPRAAGLAEFGKPQGYVQRQVAGWTERYARARTDEVPDMERLAGWLASHVPPDQPAAIIHNDFKYDNVVLDPGALTTVRAVLDWEMSTLGDPVADLGMTLAYWFEPGEAEMVGPAAFGPTALPGNLTREEIVQRSAARSGRPVDDVVFHYVLGLFKVAVIAQQIYFRYRQGLTQDERFAGLGFAVALLAQVAVRAVDRGRISKLLD